MIERGVFDTWRVTTKISDLSTRAEAMRWCVKHLAPNDPSNSYHCNKYAWTHQSFPNKVIFTFDREKDAMLFALRWS